jgi:ATP-dependent Clp protease adapter protein ClpS
MMEAHTSGQAVVVVCPLEQAEFYRDRIKTFGLGVTIEKA